MPTQIRNDENKIIEALLEKLELTLGNELVVKRKSNSLSLVVNVSRHQEHLTLIEGCQSRQEFIKAIKIAYNSIVMMKAIWLEAPAEIVDDYIKNKV